MDSERIARRSWPNRTALFVMFAGTVMILIMGEAGAMFLLGADIALGGAMAFWWSTGFFVFRKDVYASERCELFPFLMLHGFGAALTVPRPEWLQLDGPWVGYAVMGIVLVASILRFRS